MLTDYLPTEIIPSMSINFKDWFHELLNNPVLRGWLVIIGIVVIFLIAYFSNKK